MRAVRPLLIRRAAMEVFLSLRKRSWKNAVLMHRLFFENSRILRRYGTDTDLHDKGGAATFERE